MPILFVHGRSQEGKDPAVLHELWRQSMARGASLLDATKSFFPFYGDRLAGLVPRSFAVDAEFALRSVDSLDEETRLVATEISLEYADIAAARASASRLVIQPRAVTGALDPDDLFRRANAAPDPDAELRGKSLNAFLAVVDSVVPGASGLVVEFMRDVAIYLSNDSVRETVLKIVKAELDNCKASAAAAGEPVVVISHSLGTVVAHDLLDAEPAGSVALFMTLGSPLGVQTIRKRLRSNTRGHTLWPRAASMWINASDPRDLVALVPAFGRTSFFGSPSKDSGERCDVLNLVDLANDTDKHHSITGYLDHPELAEWVFRCLRSGNA